MTTASNTTAAGSLTSRYPAQSRWISRLGHAYQVHPRPIIDPLPDPIDRDGPAPALVVPCPNDLGMWDDYQPEPATKPPPKPSPPPDRDEYPPPF